MFGNVIDAEGEYFRKTASSHHAYNRPEREVYEKHRWLAMSMYKACDQAKNIVLKGLLQTGGAPLYSILPGRLGSGENAQCARRRLVALRSKAKSCDSRCTLSVFVRTGLSARLVTMDELFAAETFDEFKI